MSENVINPSDMANEPKSDEIKEQKFETKEARAEKAPSKSKMPNLKIPKINFDFKKHQDKVKSFYKSIVSKLFEYKSKAVPVINNYWSKAKDLVCKNKKISLGAGAVILVLVIAAIALSFGGKKGSHAKAVSGYVISNSNHYVGEVGKEAPISQQLNDVSIKLAKIEQKLGGHAYINLGQIRSDLSNLNAQVSSIADRSNQIITKQIKSSTAQLKGQLNTIKKEISVMSVSKEHHKMLKPSNLPFKVISIDNIQESEVVTISFAHRFIPLEIGDSIAGWTLVSASNVDQKAQFRNANEDYVALNLNNLEAVGAGE